MNEDELQAMIDGFISKHNKVLDEGNYHDFLANYMHALNHKATQDQLDQFGASVPQDQRDAMLGFADSKGAYDRNPYIQEGRSGVISLLNSLRGSK